MPPAFPLTEEQINAFVTAALAEDVGPGDVTCESVIPEGARLTATLSAREDCIVCALTLAAAFFQQLDPDVEIVFQLEDGASVQAGTALMHVSGKARALLTAERSALNSLQVLSGIATHCARYAQKLAGLETKLLDTRKTLPGYRLLSKYAAVCGGATNHRIGLFDAVMIKDNHIAVAGGVAAAIAAAKSAGQTQIQVECDTLEQAQSAVDAGATSLLLDNMSLEDLREAVDRFGGTIPLEASGGVTLDTIEAIGQTGVDYVSVGGAMTLSAPAIDIGMDYQSNAASS